MLLCFSKRSPMVNKNCGRNRRMGRRTWSPQLRERDRYGRWHEGEVYTRVGDEYRPKCIEEDDTRSWEEEGYRRNRKTSRDVYSENENGHFGEKNERKHSLGKGGEKDDFSSGKTTKVLVHKDRLSKTAESFRSSMLWKELDPSKLPKGNVVQPTFPPNRYSIIPEIPAQVCPNPVVAAKKPTFRVNLDVSHYAPNEVVVQVEDGFLMAEGKHFSESDFGFETCEFYRKYPLPDGLDSSDISYKINSDGILVVTGGAMTDDQKVKQNTLNNECKRSNALRNERRFSTYDNNSKEVSRKVESSCQQNVGFGDFTLIEGNCYVLLVNVNGYSPQEMKVTVIGNEISVYGTKKVEVNEGNEKRVIQKEFTKKFYIPEDADVDSIASRMTKDGHLKIECSKI